MFTPTYQSTLYSPRCLSSILCGRNQETRITPSIITIMPTVTELPVPADEMHFEEAEEPAECIDNDLGPTAIDEVLDSSRHKQRRKGPRITDEKIEAVKQLIGAFYLDCLKQMEKNEQRRPILAIVAEQYNRSVVQAATGIKISEKEFSNARKHARWPGPIQPVSKSRTFRNRFKDNTITALLHCLETGGKLQRNAFGTKICEILGGRELVTIENIERSQKVSRII
jgi:hypothetical protein